MSRFLPISQRILTSERMTHFPLRLVLSGFHDGIDGRPLQRLVPKPKTISESVTVADVLKFFLPNISSGLSVIIQGLKVEMETPIAWIYRHMAHADLFVYIVVFKINP